MGIALANVDLSTVFTGIGSMAKDIRQALTGELDPAARAAIIAKSQDLDVQLQLAQIAVNQAEAANPNLFVSGARPAAIWICDLGLLYVFIVRPLLTWLSPSIGLTALPPDIDGNALMTLIMALLGLGGYRTYEKAKGVAS